MRNFKTSTLRQGNDQVKKHEIDNAYSTNDEKRIRVGFWCDSQEERDNWENIVAGGRILLKYALGDRGLCGMDWTDLAQNRNQCRVLMNIAINLQVP
jgi:hypothetical protein